MKVYFPKHKSDQIGLNKDEARHIYSNPLLPEVCPIRAMASYLIAFPDVFIEGVKLFPGRDQKRDLMLVFIVFCKVMNKHFNQFL